MSAEYCPKWLRWLLFLPLATLAMVVMHTIITITFAGNEDKISVFGIAIEGPSVQWINVLKYNALAMFLEPWAFVTVGGIVAPCRLVPSAVLAIIIILLCLTVPAISLATGGPASTTAIAILRGVMGTAGGIAGVISVLQYKTKHDAADARISHGA